MKVTGLAVKDSKGRLRRVKSSANLSVEHLGLRCHDTYIFFGSAQVRRLSEEQKEMVRKLSSPSQIDVKAAFLLFDP